jgi:small subunit ribosomal protein S4e
MANKGSSSHMKRLNAPRYFAIHRKEHKYTIKQNPGRHTLAKSIALTLMIEKVGLAPTRAESNRAIREGLASVNGKKIMDPKYPVGLNDSISIGPEHFMIKINEKGQIHILKNEKHAAKQLYKVVGKYKYAGNKIMLRLHDGNAVNGTNDANVDDSVLISDGKISKVVKFHSGSKCEIIDGVHVGKAGTIKEVNAGNMHRSKSVLVEQHNGEKFETLAKNIIVVD